MRLSSRLSDIDRERLISSHPWCLCVLPCGPCVFPCCVLVFSPCALCYLSRVFFVTSRVCSLLSLLFVFSSFVSCDLCFCLVVFVSLVVFAISLLSFSLLSGVFWGFLSFVVFGFLPVVLCSLPLFCSSCLMMHKKRVQKSGNDKKDRPTRRAGDHKKY